MAEDYGAILQKFIKERLGGLAGGMLLDLYLKKIGVARLSELDEKNLIKFSDYFIYNVFKNHMSREDIDSIRLQLNLQFCFNKASEKIKNMLSSDITLKPLTLKFEDKESFDMILNSLTKEITAITVDIHGYLKGSFLFFIFKDSAINLANMMIKSMLGTTSDTEGLDEMKESAIKEFMNIIIPTFLGTVSNTLGKDIRHKFSTHSLNEVNFQIAEALAKANEQKDGKDVIKKILSTDVEINVLGTKIQGVCFFLLEVEGTLQSSLEKSDIKKDMALIDIDITKISVTRGKSTKDSLVEFMNHFYPGEGIDKVEAAMAQVNIGGFSHLSVGQKRDFSAVMINRYFRDYADRVIHFVRKTLEEIFGVQLITTTTKIQKEDEKDVMGKMIRE